jgi:hypothetical protein
VISEDRPQAHRTSMKDGLMTKTAQTCVSMNNLNLLSNHNVAEDWKERENCWESSLSVDDEKRYMVDFEAVRQIADTCSAFVGVRDDNDFVAAIDEFLLEFSTIRRSAYGAPYSRQLINMTFYSSRLWEEEVADHTVEGFSTKESRRTCHNARNVVRHLGCRVFNRAGIFQ